MGFLGDLLGKAMYASQVYAQADREARESGIESASSSGYNRGDYLEKTAIALGHAHAMEDYSDQQLRDVVLNKYNSDADRQTAADIYRHRHVQRSIDSRQKKPRSILKALFDFKLDRAFVMELARRTKVVELKDSLFKELLYRFIRAVQVFSTQEFFEPAKNTFHNSIVMRSAGP